MRGSPMFPPNQWRSNRASLMAIRNSRLQNSPQILLRCHNAHNMRLGGVQHPSDQILQGMSLQFPDPILQPCGCSLHNIRQNPYVRESL